MACLLLTAVAAIAPGVLGSAARADVAARNIYYSLSSGEVRRVTLSWTPPGLPVLVDRRTVLSIPAGDGLFVSDTQPSEPGSTIARPSDAPISFCLPRPRPTLIQVFTDLGGAATAGIPDGGSLTRPSSAPNLTGGNAIAYGGVAAVSAAPGTLSDADDSAPPTGKADRLAAARAGASQLLANLSPTQGIVQDPAMQSVLLFSGSHITQVSSGAAAPAVLSDLDISTIAPGGSLLSGASDGQGHIIGVGADGRLVLLDISNTGLVGSPLTPSAVLLLDPDVLPPPPGGPTGGIAGECLWNAGVFDQRSAQYSTADPYLGEQQTADDVYIPVGCMSRWDKITATLIGDSLFPKARLRVYDDCDGKPGALLYTLDSTQLTDTGQTYSGQRVWTVEFDPSNLWLSGGWSGHVYWVSIMGLAVFADDQWFWATTGSGNIAGVPGMYRAALNGIPSWTSVAGFGCGCSDFTLHVEGDCCKILWDNGGPDPVGASPSIIDAPGTTIRSADNFEVPPCDPVSVCFLRAVIYSNCLPMRGQFEIYANECNAPAGSPLFAAPFSRTIDLGYSVVINGDTFRAYEAQAYDLSWTLPGGATYWLMAAGQGGGTIHQRSYFAFASDCARCPIRLSPGMVLSPGLALPAWTSADQLLGVSRDLSFLVAVRPPAATPPIGPPTTCPADLNQDGEINIADLLDYLNAWFAGCP